MSSKQKNKKQSQGADILENPEALASQISKSEEFIKKHKSLVTIVGSAIILIVVGIVGYRFYINNQNQEAQSEMYQAIYYFEQDSLELALRGDGNNLGFVDIAADYGNTKAGNLANFYAGSIYLKQGKYDLCLLYLESFSSDDLLYQARAFSLMGDLYMQQSNFENAVTYYKEAIDYNPNKYFTPIYLLKAALAYEKMNDPENAIKAYQEITKKYFESDQYQVARKHLARLGGSES